MSVRQTPRSASGGGLRPPRGAEAISDADAIPRILAARSEQISYWPSSRDSVFVNGATQTRPPARRLRRAIWESSERWFRDRLDLHRKAEAIIYLAEPVEVGGRIVRGAAESADGGLFVWRVDGSPPVMARRFWRAFLRSDSPDFWRDSQKRPNAPP